jgi:O-antigen/teichoic acid export membrane protein
VVLSTAGYMSIERKIFKNTFLLSAGKNFGDILSFIFLMYFGRFFGAESLGKYSFGMAFGGLFVTFTSFGFNSLTVREVSKDESVSQKYIGNLIIIRGAISILVFAFICIGAYFSQLQFDTKLILILMSGYHIFCRLSGLFKSSFRAHDCMHYSALLEFYHKLILLIFGLGAMMLFHRPILTLTFYPLSAFSMFLIAILLYNRKIGIPDFNVDSTFVKKSIYNAFPFFIIIILGQFYDRIGIIILTMLKGEESVGLFSAADRMLVTLFAGMIIFNSVLIPYLFKLAVQSMEQFYRLGERFLRLAYVILLSICISAFVLSEPIIRLTFGYEFQNSILILQVHIWSFIFVGLNQILASMIIVLQREKKLLKIRIAAYLMYCMASILLIYKFDYLGLAFTKILIESFLFFTTIFLVYRLSDMPRLLKQSYAPLISAVVGLAIFFLLKNATLWLTFPATLTTYIICLFVFKGIYFHDFTFLYQILFRKKDHPGSTRLP